ncbi:MAG TPA: DNA topoisomerase IV subunit A [Bacillota bacterium]|nr:DNA topoisomerase IV subunit A [Bacillota bacterium]
MTEVENLLSLPLEDVIGDRFGRYSKYIIQERALPDVRDGLKPVQRRILYAMNEDGNTYDKNFRKAARTVGTVIGNYHPHGDTSVYDAMVRLSQDWKMRNILIEMHGNNGSIDGDPAAAMRYTETKLSKIASELVRNIEKDTVDFVPNFDDTNEEPVVFPAKFPNLLVNGSTGISAGYATDIPPHNLEEVIDAVIKKIDKPTVTVAELMKIIKGPDFPTGGIVQGTDGIKKAFKTGRGRIIIRGRATIEKMRGNREKIVIDEIPYDVNKANLVRKIDELAFDRKVEGIAEVRDETDRTGLRIVIELRKDAHSEGVLNYLYKHTDLQVSYNYNMVAIQDKTPKLLSLPKILEAYIEHQKEVVTRQTTFDLNKAQERAHIVAGLIKAISVLDELIQTIRQSKNKQDAKNRIIEQFDFTERQAEAIVTLQLYRLTNTDVTALEKEAKELETTITQLEAILASENKLLQTIKQDLRRVKETYHTKRLTTIEQEIETIEVDIEAMVASEDVLVSVTKDGYIKRTSLRSYTASNGEDFPLKDKDFIVRLLEINTTDNILLFTNKGRYMSIPVHELPDIRWKDVGQHLSHLSAINNDETIVACIPIRELNKDHYLVFFTKNGLVKRSELSLYDAKRFTRPLIALNLREGDELINVELSDGKNNIFVVTNTGYSLLYKEEEVNPVGQRATGVIAIQLKDDEHVASGFIIQPNNNQSLVLMTQRGACKRMALNDLELSKRANRGQLILRELKGKPHRIVNVYLTDDEDAFVLRTKENYSEKIYPLNLPISDRLSNGSFIIDEDEHGQVITTWRLAPYERPFSEEE